MGTFCTDQWPKLRDFMTGCPDGYLGREADRRRFIAAVQWNSRTGAPWRALPPRYSPWNTAYKRFARWCDRGIWAQILAPIADAPNLEHLMRDRTVV